VAILAATMLTTSAADAALPPGGTFFDDDGNEHEAAIEAIAAAGITRGCSDMVDDLFCPEHLVTRGQLAAMLRRALELTADPRDWFDDDDESIFEGDINALAGAGITFGCDERSFCPELPVTRAQMASFLVRALELEPAESPFVDDDGIVHESAISSLAAAGITRGCNPPLNDRFCPDDPLRRDHTASFLARALGLALQQPPPRPSIRLAFSGDTLIHSPVNTAAGIYGETSGEKYDFRPMFEPVRELISSADLAICHLEVPLSPTSTDLSGYPTFNAPAELADALVWAGYDGCSTASNHSMDRGPVGISNTLRVLRGAGLGYSGMAVDEEDTGATFYQVGGTAIAHLSYTYGLNGFVEPADQPWLVDLIDAAAMLEDAARARADGADLVVSVHWGAEYQAMPTSFQRRLGRTLIASAHIDLVVGHHAHVIQPVEELGGEFIIYGLGNFLSNQRSRVATQDGVVLFAEVVDRGDAWVVRRLEASPTWVEGGSFRILPAGASSIDRTLAVLSAFGSFSAD
jgi:poly-gamma-glutamate synthesis protein (capsule biosynthesis protein)